MRGVWARGIALLTVGPVAVACQGCRAQKGSGQEKAIAASRYEKPASAAPRVLPQSRGSARSELPKSAQRMLEKNGFVVLGDVERRGLTDAYFETMPNFITADAVLYVFHCLFRGALTAYEKQELLPLTGQVVSLGLAAARDDADRLRRDKLLAEPSRRNLVFFAVAQAVLTGQPPKDEAQEAGGLVAKIEAANEGGYYPNEDFTMYQPRGVYADDEELARYYRAMRWLSRYILPIIPGRMDTPDEADIKLRQARLLGDMLEGNGRLRKAWQKLYDEISFFIARPDSFRPLELVAATKPFGATFDDEWLAKVRSEFAKDKYPASTIMPVLQHNPGDAPSKYVQFMGERFIPDGQVMQETCFPYVGNRIIPKGLDVGFALFDSPRAMTHLAQELKSYPGLEQALRRLRLIFATYGAQEEPDSVYAGWVGAAREVLHPPLTEHTPKFMRTDAWADKSLATCLASWAEMRHDFILYAKETMIPASAGPSALVEPVPETYGRLEKLARKLAGRGFPGFADFEKLCRNLRIVAECELAGKEWRQEVDSDMGWFIESFGQWLLQRFAPHVAVERPCVVVDVACSSFPPNPVLHEATGPFNLVVARDGGQVYKGWVFSYYEFTQNDLKRVTDAEWEKRVNEARHQQYRPEWARSYLYGGVTAVAGEGRG